MPLRTILLTVLLCPALASAQWSAAVVALTDGPPVSGPIQTLVGSPTQLAVAVTGPQGALPPGTLPEGSSVLWLQVVPRLKHHDHDPPNPGNPSFSNNVLFGPDHGRWLGFDRLEYVTSPLVGARGVVTTPTITVSHAYATATGLDHAGAGSNWYAAEITLADGTTVRTPDGDDTDSLGLSRGVMRVSFRSGDDYLGWLSTYFNVPNVFGSAGPSDDRHQTERYVGADCADVLVGALRVAGQTDARYTSIAGLEALATPTTEVLFMNEVGEVLDGDGEPHPLLWGDDIAPGDLLVIDYADDPSNQLPRAWDHIGALVEDRGDRGPDGLLDGRDVLRHVTALGLDDRPLWSQSPMRMRIWRWRE